MPTAERILGAIIAGGASRRFGSDKALALIDGSPMLAHVADALRPQVAKLVICGRSWPGLPAVADLRTGRLGPLAGLEAALSAAALDGFDAVLSVPVDTLPLPENLLDKLQGDGPAAFTKHHLIGYWPILFRAALSAYLSAGHRDVTGWLVMSNARSVAEPCSLQNVNVPADLVALTRTTGRAVDEHASVPSNSILAN